MSKNRRANFIPKGRVQVYYNLHKKCLSIRHKGKVIEHAQEVTLTDARFHVQQAGRERVLKQKRKNVHAYISGKLKESFWFIQSPKYIWTAKQRVTYNPYKYKSFVDKETLEPVASAEVVHISGKRITAGDFDWSKRTTW
jgi:hypothetical protein